jgi:hypothetical protein
MCFIEVEEVSARDGEENVRHTATDGYLRVTITDYSDRMMVG